MAEVVAGVIFPLSFGREERIGGEGDIAGRIGLKAGRRGGIG